METESLHLNSYNSGEKIMNKYFDKLFYIMLIVACVLSVSLANQLESRLDKMETQIDNMNKMLKDITNG